MIDIDDLTNSLIAKFFAPALLGLSIVLGGSSGGGVLANAVLQFSALLIIIFIIATRAALPIQPGSARLALIAAAALALILVQLVPLPPEVWSRLPGRGPIAAGYAMVGTPLPWQPVSMSPDRTVGFVLSLLPAFAMFLATISSSAKTRRLLPYVLVVLTALSVMIGTLQELHAVPYIYEITSFGAVGFFANRNHLATLCLMAVPFAAAIAVSKGEAIIDRRAGRRIIAAAAVVIFAIGVIVVGSMAGWLLLAPALLGGLLVYQRGENQNISQRTAWIAGAAVIIGVALAIVAAFSIGDLGQQAVSLQPGERLGIMHVTLVAIGHSLPLGSGFGSFVDLYPSYEASNLVGTFFINHAHDEYLETLLEGGIGGIAIIAAFLFWWIGSFAQTWGRNSSSGSFGRAASLAIAVPLAHSLVDYPLRTASIATVAAMACALLTSKEAASVPNSRGRARPTGRDMIVLTGERPSSEAAAEMLPASDNAIS